MRKLTVGNFIGFCDDGYKTKQAEGVIEFQPNGNDYNVVLNTGLMVVIEDILNNAIEARNILNVLAGNPKIPLLEFKTYFNGMCGWSLSCNLGREIDVDWEQYESILKDCEEAINEETYDYTVFPEEEEVE